MTAKSSVGLAGVDAELGGVGDVAVDRGRLEELLGRDAAAVQAGAADLLLLDHRDVEAGGGAVQRGGVAARAAADDDEVSSISHAPPSVGSVRVSTRLLIVAALLCGLAILLAFTVQVLLAS